MCDLPKERCVENDNNEGASAPIVLEQMYWEIDVSQNLFSGDVLRLGRWRRGRSPQSRRYLILDGADDRMEISSVFDDDIDE